MILGGIFERYPDLKFIFTETTTRWVPEELQTMDMVFAQALIKGTHPYATVTEPLRPCPKSQVITSTPTFGWAHR